MRLTSQKLTICYTDRKTQSWHQHGCHLDRQSWSYPLRADNLRRWSDKPEADCSELFRRMVFNAAVTNNDDHPRNHALLRRQTGWRLSPAYDLVPAPVVSLERRDLALTVGDYGRTASIYNLLGRTALAR